MSRRIARVMAVVAVVALVLCIVTTLSGGDWRDLRQGTLAMALYLSRPIAGVLVWAAACMALIARALTGRGQSNHRRLPYTARDAKLAGGVAESAATIE